MAVIYDLTKRTGGGGDRTFVFSSYTIPSSTFINSAITDAHIPVRYTNEVLIWNVKGTHQQPSGTVGGKWGFVIVQNGNAITNGEFYQRMASILDPDSSTPASAMTAGGPTISDGFYTWSGATFRVGGNNVIDFIQLPYNIGWDV